MTEILRVPALSRRRTMILGGVAGSLAKGLIKPAFAESGSDGKAAAGLPVKQIEQIVGANGTVSKGVLSININRNDLKASLPGGIPVSPAELMNGTLFFQAIGDGKVEMNADFCLKPSETNPFIRALVENGLTVQAFHQHLYDLSPMYWFVHFRGSGAALDLAKATRNAIKTTSTPLPQHTPKTPPTPFDHKKLAHILGGTAQVNDGGVVTVDVDRAEQIHLGGHPIKGGLGVSTNIAFQPLGSNGSRALAISDFGLIAKEVSPVFEAMFKQGFINGCLYNQETDEQPQLYFSHQWAAGDPYDLAQKIRNGLSHTNSKFKS
jgi:hypothetical protein